MLAAGSEIGQGKVDFGNGNNLRAAYAAVENIHFDSAHFRRDIAAKAFE
jgi:phosphoribosylamine-glycine ligase